MPFAAWEPPEPAARWCLQLAGIDPEDLDAIAYSYDPALVRQRAVHFVPHHVGHAASAGLAAPFRDAAVLVADGRGEASSSLAGRCTTATANSRCWSPRNSPIVDGTARIQTVDRDDEPLLDRFAERTGLPAVVNTSLNTAGRPMVDDPRDALECFGSAPIDVLVLGPFLLRRTQVAR